MAHQRVTDYFVPRVEAARDALASLHLAKYADEVSTMTPRTLPEAERLATWCETLRSCLDAWARKPEVARVVTRTEVLAATIALDTLAGDCRTTIERAARLSHARNGGR